MEDGVVVVSLVCGVRQSEMTEVALMGFGPVGLAVVVVTEAAQEGEKPGLGAAQVVDSIGASAAKIPDGFVGGVGNVDGNEVVGAEIFGELHGVALVGLDAVPGFGGDEGGGDDVAGDPHLEKTTSDPESASARFVADVEVAEGAILTLGNAPHGSLQGMLGGGDGAVVAWLGLALRVEDCDDSFCFMHVESEVECLWCV